MGWRVYLIRNTQNGKGYVGIAYYSIESRLQEHIEDAFPGRRGTNGRLYALHAAIQKYGPENFTVEELDWCLHLEEAKFEEEYWIRKLGTYASGPGPRRGYNMSYGGEEPDPR